MFLIALLTALQWPSLFPGLRDYLALTSLPLRMRDVFIAKFSALLAFASIFIAGCNLLPSIVLPGVMGGRYFSNAVLNIVSIFVSTSLGAISLFFALVALQGLLLNLLPTAIFPRVSLVAQGALLIAILCGLPFVFSIPNLQNHMHDRPVWVVNAPPFWFLGIDQQSSKS